MLLEQMPTAKRAQCPGNDVDLGGEAWRGDHPQ